MEKEKAKKILDDISQSVKAMGQHIDYICSTMVKEVHLYKCLREISMAMELEVAEKPWKCNGMIATEISIVYNDVRFYELENYRGCEEDVHMQ